MGGVERNLLTMTPEGVMGLTCRQQRRLRLCAARHALLHCWCHREALMPIPNLRRNTTQEKPLYWRSIRPTSGDPKDESRVAHRWWACPAPRWPAPAPPAGSPCASTAAPEWRAYDRAQPVAPLAPPPRPPPDQPAAARRSPPGEALHIYIYMTVRIRIRRGRRGLGSGSGSGSGLKTAECDS